MSQHHRRRAALALVTLVALGALSAPAAGAAGAAATAPPDSATQQSGAATGSATARLAACVSGQKQLAVVLLMDESGSLDETDPGDGRVVAAQAAVAGLVDLVRRGGGQLRVDAQVAGFGVDFEQSAPWFTIDPADPAPLVGRVEGFRGRDGALDTDYVNALNGALTSLQARSRELTPPGGAPPCTAVLWFTDGRYEVEDRTSASRRRTGTDNRGEWQTKEYAQDIDLAVAGGGAATVARGREVLCSGGGLADQYRATSTTLFGVALTTAIAPADQDFLRAVVTGPGCGDLDGSANGELLAGDLSQLIGFFDQVVAGLGNPASTEDAQLAACPVDQAACPQGTRTFVVDGSLQRFHVLAEVDAPGIAVNLTAPGAPPLAIPVAGAPGATAAGSAGATPVTWSWLANTALTLDAESAPSGDNWAGTWSMTFVDTTGANPGAAVRARIYLFGDVVPQLADPVQFRAGEANGFGVRLARSEGSPIPSTSLSGEVRVTATVTDPATGSTVDLGPLTREGDRWVGTYTAPEELSASAVNLSLQAAVTTATGVALPPTAAAVPVDVLPPVGFPTVTTRFVSVGPVVGTETEEAVLAVEGSPRADTCIWLEQVRLAPGPVGTGAIEIAADGDGTGADRCLTVAEAGAGELRVRFTPAEAQRATGTGSLLLGTRSANLDDVRTVTVPFEVQLVKPARAGVAWAVFLALLALGLGVPLALFYLGNWRSAHFAPLAPLVGATVRIAVDEVRAVRLDPPPPGAAPGQLLYPEDFDGTGFDAGQRAADGKREFQFRGATLKATVSPNPFRAPAGQVRADSVVVPAGGGSRRAGNTFPLWVNEGWFVVPSHALATGYEPAESAPVEAVLCALVTATGKFSSCQKLNDRLPEQLTALDQTLRKLLDDEPRIVDPPPPTPDPPGDFDTPPGRPPTSPDVAGGQVHGGPVQVTVPQPPAASTSPPTSAAPDDFDRPPGRSAR